MPNNIKTFEQWQETNEFFSIKRTPETEMDKLKENVLDILNNLSIELDYIYFRYEKAIKNSTTLLNILSTIDNIINDLNDRSYIDDSDSDIKNELSDLRISLEAKLNERN